VAARAKAEPIVERRAGTGKKSKAHHRATRRTKLAMHKPAAKASAPAPAPAERADPRPPYDRGNALLFAGDAKGAIAAYREAVKSAPTEPIGFRGLGLAYEHEGETGAALRAFKRYLKLAPAAPDREIIQRRIDRLSKKKK
jgi:Flp pilus assembly protein TadD